MSPGPLGPIPSTVQYLAGLKTVHLEPTCDCGYQVAKPMCVQTLIFGYEGKSHDGLVEIKRGGMLYAHVGFWLDGVTAIPDFKRLMRGATVHDCVFELIRDKVLPPEAKELGDNMLIDIWKVDRVGPLGRWLGNRAMQTRWAKRSAAPIKPVILEFP